MVGSSLTRLLRRWRLGAARGVAAAPSPPKRPFPVTTHGHTRWDEYGKRPMSPCHLAPAHSHPLFSSSVPRGVPPRHASPLTLIVLSLSLLHAAWMKPAAQERSKEFLSLLHEENE